MTSGHIVMKSFVFLTPLVWLAGTVLAQTCYTPDGFAVTNPEVAPCKIDPVRTICCHSNRTLAAGSPHESGNVADECLPNGICQNRYTYQGKAEAKFWLEYCTNRDLESGRCMDVCRDARGEKGTSMITPCDGSANSTEWCCGDTVACCGGTSAISFPQRFVGMVNGTIAGSSPTPTPTTTPTPSSLRSPETGNSTSTPAGLPSGTSNPPSPSPPTPPQSPSLSTGAKAGIGIGAVLGALAILGIGFFASKVRRLKKEAQRSRAAEMSLTPSYADLYPDKYQHSGFPPSELPSHPPAELADTVRAAELGDHRESDTGVEGKMPELV
ncbi:hypothetical protein K458DRAFT_407695 [Lentithecium fluviatile CBS 122367]|uniref:Mid2 domain-containing protein n=1 Tax=Lentithecium fluviatile CBS 122367 TaxID=1168545 RepID=A0A6G1INX3_9PLEO|nr:hypothetical protein K458DRAFT_407695 [Lentithecium fluviatile CBS 122367]